MTAAIIPFPGKRVRVPPSTIAMYAGEACQLLGVRAGLVRIARIGKNGEVERIWVPADEVTMWEQIMAGEDTKPCDGAA